MPRVIKTDDTWNIRESCMLPAHFATISKISVLGPTTAWTLMEKSDFLFLYTSWCWLPGVDTIFTWVQSMAPSIPDSPGQRPHLPNSLKSCLFTVASSSLGNLMKCLCSWANNFDTFLIIIEAVCWETWCRSPQTTCKKYNDDGLIYMYLKTFLKFISVPSTCHTSSYELSMGLG